MSHARRVWCVCGAALISFAPTACGFKGAALIEVADSGNNVAGAAGAIAGAAGAGAAGAGVAGAGAGAVVDLQVVSAGEYHTCAAGTSGLYCWGQGTNGALGNQDTGNQSVAVEAHSQTPLKWDQISLGSQFGCALESTGRTVWCWGQNDGGQLGIGDQQDQLVPTRTLLTKPAAQISAGYDHACAITTDGALFCWGKNQVGQAGLISFDLAVVDPTQVGTDSDWLQVTGGQSYGCGIRSPGTLWCWGFAQYGANGVTASPVAGPEQVGSDEDWAQVDGGQDITCAVKQDGSLWCLGIDLGDPSISTAAPVQLGSDQTWGSVSVDFLSACALTKMGALFCWGRNAEGELGLGDVQDRTDPTLVPNVQVSAISAGRFHACIVGASGLECAGKGDAGQLGNGSFSRSDQFAAIQFNN